MIRYFPLLLPILLHTCLIYPLSGQDKKTAPIRFQTLCLEQIKELPTLYFHHSAANKNKGQFHAVELPVANFSRAIYKTTTRTVEFYGESVKAGDPLPTPMATALIPAGMSKVFLLFIPKADGKSYHVTAYDSDLVNFKGGDQLFVNLTKAKLGINVGGKKLTIDPSRAKPLRLSNKEKVRETLEMYSKQNQSWHRFSSSRITIDPRLRRLILCYYVTSEQRIRSRAIWDRVDQTQKESQ